MLQTLPIIGVGSRAAVVTTDQLSLDSGHSFYYIFYHPQLYPLFIASDSPSVFSARSSESSARQSSVGFWKRNVYWAACL